MTPQMLSYQDEYEREHCAKGKKNHWFECNIEPEL